MHVSTYKYAFEKILKVKPENYRRFSDTYKSIFNNILPSSIVYTELDLKIANKISEENKGEINDILIKSLECDIDNVKFRNYLINNTYNFYIGTYDQLIELSTNMIEGDNYVPERDIEELKNCGIDIKKSGKYIFSIEEAKKLSIYLSNHINKISNMMGYKTGFSFIIDETRYCALVV
jgi:hypothetical protein